MKVRHIGLALIASFGLVCSAQAQVTATCKDGTTYAGAQRTGACARHGGVKEWTTPEASPAPAAPQQNSPAGRRGGTVDSSSNPDVADAPAGRAGQVWVNTATHVYHCPGDRWYGKTKRGGYMSEAQAKAAGNRPDHNKACS